MDSMTERDWICLSNISRGEATTAALSKVSRRRLEALEFIVTRPRNQFAVTGLGREALIRRKHRLGLPAAEAMPAPQCQSLGEPLLPPAWAAPAAVPAAGADPA